MNKQLGFSVVELGLVCGVVLIVGVLGYVFYDRWIDGVAPIETAETETVDAPTIATVEDLSKAEAALDEAGLDDDTTLTELDSELASFQ